MKNKIIVVALIIVIVASVVCIFKFNPYKTASIEIVNIQPTASVDTASSSEPAVVASAKPKSYAYLFQESREPMTSNIVGNFGYGAFAWYVPDWLVSNWKLESPDDPQGMVFVPHVRDNPEDFSDITFTVKPSTEVFNAQSLYQAKIDAKSNLVLNEVLLNKHSGDMLTLQIETDTRIYHVVDMNADGIHENDTYYIDGNGKTLVLTFNAKKDIFPQFTDKIRSMVEGIGELKSPQG